MNKNILIVLFTITLNTTNLQLHAQKKAWHTWKTWGDLPIKIRRGLSSEKNVWKFGVRAAKKKLWHKRELTQTEQQYYKKFLKQVGGITAVSVILSIIGGASISKFTRKNWRDRLLDAAWKNNLGIIQTLLAAANGRNPIDATDDQGRTALMLAAQRGNDAIIHELLNAGAQINKQDQWGSTPLIWAAYGGNYSTVDLLLDKGADPTQKTTKTHQTALDIARETKEKSSEEHKAQYDKIIRRLE